MLKNILDLLKILNGNTENIRIAQGKYKMPENFSEGFKQIKQTVQWHKK